MFFNYFQLHQRNWTSGESGILTYIHLSVHYCVAEIVQYLHAYYSNRYGCTIDTGIGDSSMTVPQAPSTERYALYHILLSNHRYVKYRYIYILLGILQDLLPIFPIRRSQQVCWLHLQQLWCQQRRVGGVSWFCQCSLCDVQRHYGRETAV